MCVILRCKINMGPEKNKHKTDLTNTEKNCFLFSLPYPTWQPGLHQKGIWGILCSFLPPHGLSVVLWTTKGPLIESSRQFLCTAGFQMLWACDSVLLANGANGQRRFFLPKIKTGFWIVFLVHQGFLCSHVRGRFLTLSCVTSEKQTNEPDHRGAHDATSVKVNYCHKARWIVGVKCILGVFSCLSILLE